MSASITIVPLAFLLVSLATPAPAEDVVPSPQDTQRVSKELSPEDPAMADELLRLGKFYQERFAGAPEAAKAQLNALQRKAAQENWTFQPAYTAVFGRDISKLTGLKVPPNVTEIAKRQNEFAAEARSSLKLSAPPICDPRAKKFNLRSLNKVSPVVDQGMCGSCWAFTSVAVYESNYLIRGGRMPNASEQHVLDCSLDLVNNTEAGSCDGGWYYSVFNWWMTTPVTNRRAAPYEGIKSPSCRFRNGEYLSLVWGFVDPDHWNEETFTPPIESIKQAICEHGAVAVAVNASEEWTYYGGGVYNVDVPGDINHAVTLVGWDDDLGAWLIKNSWSRAWGDRGFMWIKYGTSKIGSVPAWVEVSLQRPSTEVNTVMRRYKDIFGDNPASGQ